MKIALFIANLEGGGAERVMVTLANEFHKKGYSIDLVLVRATGPFLQEVAPGIKIIPLGSRKTIFSVFSLVRYLRSNRPDVILSTLLTANIISVLAHKLSGVKTRTIVREAIAPSAENNFSHNKTERIISLLRRWALKNSDHIIAPSHGVAKDITEYWGIDSSKVSVVYNPVDLDKTLVLSHDRIDQYIDIFQKPVVLSLGRLHFQKDFETLIRSFAKIRDTRDVNLVILGEGPERDNLKNLAESLNITDNVFFPGFVNNPYPFLRLAQVFVLSSRYEGMPNALIQATLFEKQIVATDCPSGPREILANGQYGSLVPIGDVDGLVIGIIDGLRGKLNVIPIESVLANFESGTIAEHYLSVLFPR